MFTGIVERSVAVLRVSDDPQARRLWLQLDSDLACGESVAINGVCLTVAEVDSGVVRFEVIRETLDKTTLGSLRPGELVHVERAMRIGARFDGHFVQGHVDGVGRIVKQVNNSADWRVVVEVPEQLARYLVPKGSIAVDGVSMTLAKVGGRFFELAVIPTTLAITQLGKRPVGSSVNLECDVLAKTIVGFLESREGAAASIERFWE